MNPAVMSDNDSLGQQSVVDYKKKQKQRKALAYLYAEGNSTLAQLTKVLHGSVPSVTGLVEELIEDKWVAPIGIGIGSNGRRPVLFGLNTKQNYIAILDVSTHDTKILFMDTRRNVVSRENYSLRIADNPTFMPSLAQCFTNALAASGLNSSDVLAIGMSMPGLIDAHRGLNLTYKSLNPADTSLTNWLSEQTGKPVYLINDTKATVLGESRFGRAKGKKQVLAINIDWGVGLGIVINGEVFQGASGFAGELGHIQVDPSGERCHCGKIGCLNTITSASALVSRAQRDILAGQPTKLAAFRDHVDQIDIDDLIQAAQQADSYAIKILNEVGFQLGKGLSVAISLLNPEIIIVDGVLAKAASFILTSIEEAIGQYCLGDFQNDLRIEVTQLEGAANWLGTHAYVMEDILATY
ncbi:ROK family protein [Spirosoma gilvum]